MTMPKPENELDPERSRNGQKKAPWLLQGSDQKTEEAVTYLHNKGWTMREIAIMMGTTKNALIGWMHRRGFSTKEEEL